MSYFFVLLDTYHLFSELLTLCVLQRLSVFCNPVMKAAGCEQLAQPLSLSCYSSSKKRGGLSVNAVVYVFTKALTMCFLFTSPKSRSSYVSKSVLQSAHACARCHTHTHTQERRKHVGITEITMQ